MAYKDDIGTDRNISAAAECLVSLLDDIVIKNLDERSPMPREFRYKYFNENRKYSIQACRRMAQILESDRTVS